MLLCFEALTSLGWEGERDLLAEQPLESSFKYWTTSLTFLECQQTWFADFHELECSSADFICLFVQVLLGHFWFIFRSDLFLSFRILSSSPLPSLPPIINAIGDGYFIPQCNWLDNLEFEDQIQDTRYIEWDNSLEFLLLFLIVSRVCFAGVFTLVSQDCFSRLLVNVKNKTSNNMLLSFISVNLTKIKAH